MINRNTPLASVIAQSKRERCETRVDTAPACIELFRRAFAGDDLAWAALKELFDPLMRRWIGTQNRLESEDVLQEAWVAFTRYAPCCSNLLEQESIGAVLAYLRSCVKTSLLTLLRRQPAELTGQSTPISLQAVERLSLRDRDPAQETVVRLTLESRIAALLQTCQERLIWRLYFVGGMKPQAVLAQSNGIFETIDGVNTTIQRVLRRLRKDETLQMLHYGANPALQSLGAMAAN